MRVVGGDDPLHELVADDVLAAEVDEGDVLDLVEDVADDDQPGALVGRQVDLGDVAGDDHPRVEAEPGEEHLHLLGAGVLRLVEDHEGVVERAAAHEGERRDLDHAALEVAVDAVGVEHVVERVEERPQVGVDLGLDVAGQEAEPLAGLDRGPGEDDPLHLFLGQRGGRHRDREEGLAGAGGADPEGDRVAADRVDVAFLVDRLRRDLGVAVAPDDVLEDLRRALVRVEGAGHRFDRPRGDLVPLLDQLDQLVDDRGRGLHVARVAVEGEDVAAQVEVDLAQVPAQRAQDGVLGARELGGDGVVEGQLPTSQAAHAPPR